MAKLILIGGPPAVGKSSLRGKLDVLFEDAAFLDADDVWRVRPFEVNAQYPFNNVITVLRSYLEADYSLVFLTWVLAKTEMSERILRELEGMYEAAHLFHLVASEDCLKERGKKRGLSEEELEFSLTKRRDIMKLDTPKIDTSESTPEEVAAAIKLEVLKFTN